MLGAFALFLSLALTCGTAATTTENAPASPADLALALVVAVPVGMLSALRRGGAVDAVARLAAPVGTAAPYYALASGLVLLFAVKLSWLPTIGYGTVQRTGGEGVASGGITLRQPEPGLNRQVCKSVNYLATL